MNRYAVRIFSLLAAAGMLSLAAHAGTARAAGRETFVFEGRTIVFDRIVDQPAGRAVAIDDRGTRGLLGVMAATASWQSGQRYILITTAQPQVISFALGDRRYDNGPVTQTAQFAPFLLDGHAFVPFDELLHALGLAVKTQGALQILQPQITSLDLQQDAGGEKLIARGGMPLDGRIVAQSADKVVVAFSETGSSLPPSRSAGDAAIRRIDVRTEGSALHPRTIVTLSTAPGAGAAVAGTDDQRDFTLAFGAAASQTGAVTPPPSPSPSATAAAVHVTGVQMQSQGAGFTLQIAVDGPASYDWHRLRSPDNRLWVDVHGARLGMAPQDNPVRVHQQSPDTVRIAVTLDSYQTVDVTPGDQGITVKVGPELADDSAPRSGAGTTGPSASVAQAPPSSWKFLPHPSPSSTYVPANPRLIVIDPGHGGSDVGSCWPTGCNGVTRSDDVEKVLNLDISSRLRTILVARGWQVMMTRDSDRDVYAPNDDASVELQARDDVANHNGARVFVSVHVNSFINSGPNGATVYYYKADDFALAKAIDRRIASELSLKNDGVVKDKLYVIHHADMPASLVEAAFISNPDDRVLLRNPQWRQSMARAIADGIEDYTGPAPAAQTGPGQ